MEILHVFLLQKLLHAFYAGVGHVGEVVDFPDSAADGFLGIFHADSGTAVHDERNTAIQNKARAISGDITMLAVLLAAMFFQAFEGPEISGWISWLLLGIVIGNLFLSLAMHCWLQRKM